MCEQFQWPVVPLCGRQLRDVDPADVLNGGLYRKCNVYKSGGGYDHFPDICESRFGKRLSKQFVPQLQGCPLRCPYCYVTTDGVGGQATPVNTTQLICDFLDSNQEIFHLMGGAPALYLEHWPELIGWMPGSYVFTSDFLLVEKPYDEYALKRIASFTQCVFAVSIKGSNPDNFKRNTGVELNEYLLWSNLGKLVRQEVPFYITFTGMTDDEIDYMSTQIVYRFGLVVLKDSFKIDLVRYKALDK